MSTENAANLSIDFYAKRAKDFKKLSEKAVKLLECFKEKAEGKIKTKDIIEATGFPRRIVTTNLKIFADKEFMARYGQGAATHFLIAKNHNSFKIYII